LKKEHSREDIHIRRRWPEKPARYLLSWSDDDGVMIPVLSTRRDLLTVVDVDVEGWSRDRVLKNAAEEGALGFQVTPAGFHLYFGRGHHDPRQDVMYAVFSSNRRRWHERILDGERVREPPEAVVNDERIRSHCFAYAGALLLLAEGCTSESVVLP